jgi:hypothetical protein
MDNDARDAAVERVRALRRAILGYPESEHRRLFEWLHTPNGALPRMLPPGAAAWLDPRLAERAHALLIAFTAPKPVKPKPPATGARK